jgi:hypothetical protein
VTSIVILQVDFKSESSLSSLKSLSESRRRRCAAAPGTGNLNHARTHWQASVSALPLREGASAAASPGAGARPGPEFKFTASDSGRRGSWPAGGSLAGRSGTVTMTRTLTRGPGRPAAAAAPAWRPPGPGAALRLSRHGVIPAAAS